MKNLVILHRTSDNEKVVVNLCSVKYFVRENGLTRFFFKDGTTMDFDEHIDNIIEALFDDNDF